MRTKCQEEEVEAYWPALQGKIPPVRKVLQWMKRGIMKKKEIKEETNYSVGFKWISRFIINISYYHIDSNITGD